MEKPEIDDRPAILMHNGVSLLRGINVPDEVDQISSLDIRDSDVFVVTYPKSGTIWMQQILVMLGVNGDLTAVDVSKQSNCVLVPWIEVKGQIQMFREAPSPRTYVTHLPCRVMPAALRQRRGKVIYVARNPKDILVSYFHFHKIASMLETHQDFDVFFEKFLRGDVYGGSWFEHIKDWCQHKDDVNFLFLTYEDMIRDLRSAVERICSFIGKELTDEQLANVVKYSTFHNMKKIPLASYENLKNELIDHRQGAFMRKGTIGDWKNHFTVSQNEKFDRIFQKEMKDFPLTFTWDLRDSA